MDEDEEAGNAADARQVHREDRHQGRLPGGRQRQRRVRCQGPTAVGGRAGHRSRHRRADGLEGRGVDPQRASPRSSTVPGSPTRATSFRHWQGVPFDPERDQSLPWQSGLRRAGLQREPVAGVDREVRDQDGGRTLGPGAQGSHHHPVRDARLGRSGHARAGQRPRGLHGGRLQRGDCRAPEADGRRPDPPGVGQQLHHGHGGGRRRGSHRWSGDIASLGEEVHLRVRVPGVRRDALDGQHAHPGDGAPPEQRRTAHGLLLRPEPSSAELAAWVQYICPVVGAQEAMEKIDPSLVDNPLIFPTTEDLEKTTCSRP